MFFKIKKMLNGFFNNQKQSFNDLRNNETNSEEIKLLIIKLVKSFFLA